MSAHADAVTEDVAVRPLVAKLVHAVSLHQAEWPVVGIDLDDPAFVASRASVDAALRGVKHAVGRTFGRP